MGLQVSSECWALSAHANIKNYLWSIFYTTFQLCFPFASFLLFLVIAFLLPTPAFRVVLMFMLRSWLELQALLNNCLCTREYAMLLAWVRLVHIALSKTQPVCEMRLNLPSRLGKESSTGQAMKPFCIFDIQMFACWDVEFIFHKVWPIQLILLVELIHQTLYR